MNLQPAQQQQPQKPMLASYGCSDLTSTYASSSMNRSESVSADFGAAPYNASGNGAAAAGPGFYARQVEQSAAVAASFLELPEQMKAELTLEELDIVN